MAAAAIGGAAVIWSVYADDGSLAGAANIASLTPMLAAALALGGVLMLVPWRLYMLRRWAAVVILLGPVAVFGMTITISPYAWDPNCTAALLGSLAAAVILAGSAALAWRDLKPGL